MGNSHIHKPTNTTTLDDISFETVCADCGMVFPSEPSAIEHLDRCFSLEEFQKVRYGPATPQGLQSFLLPMPTDKRLKINDQFIDTNILNTLRTYTDIQRIGELVGLPQFFIDEAMRLLLKRGKGMFSQQKQVHALMQIIHVEMMQRKDVVEKNHSISKTDLSHFLTKLQAFIEPRKETDINSDKMAHSMAVIRGLIK